MAYIAISEVKIFKYECEKCLRDWAMSLPGKDSRFLEKHGYFCPYCGAKHDTEVQGFATDKEAEFVDLTPPNHTPFVDLTEPETTPTFTIKAEEKSSTRLEAEDSLTQKRCPDGGWWNPITERCQGEGVGHNLKLDNDDQS
jgi:hypothetical protein